MECNESLNRFVECDSKAEADDISEVRAALFTEDEAASFQGVKLQVDFPPEDPCVGGVTDEVYGFDPAEQAKEKTAMERFTLFNRCMDYVVEGKEDKTFLQDLRTSPELVNYMLKSFEVGLNAKNPLNLWGALYNIEKVWEEPAFSSIKERLIELTMRRSTPGSKFVFDCVCRTLLSETEIIVKKGLRVPESLNNRVIWMFHYFLKLFYDPENVMNELLFYSGIMFPLYLCCDNFVALDVAERTVVFFGDVEGPKKVDRFNLLFLEHIFQRVVSDATVVKVVSLITTVLEERELCTSALNDKFTVLFRDFLTREKVRYPVFYDEFVVKRAGIARWTPSKGKKNRTKKGVRK
jgi:hypothetical protein